MAKAVATKQAIQIAVEGGEKVTLFVRQPRAVEHQDFLTGRFRRKGNAFTQDVVAARVKLMNALLVDCDGVEYDDAEGNTHTLRPSSLPDAHREHLSAVLGTRVNDWRDVIPAHWKSTAAQVFEEQTLEGN